MHKKRLLNMLSVRHSNGVLKTRKTWKGTKRSDDKLAQQTDESSGAWCRKVTDELCNVERGFDETNRVNEADQQLDSTIYSTKYIILDGWNM